jgi:transcription elongation factor Elf1
MTDNLTRLPEWFSLPIECSHCDFKFITTVEKLRHIGGYLCPHCSKEVSIKEAGLQKRIEETAIMYEKVVKAFMEDEIRRRHGVQ